MTGNLEKLKQNLFERTDGKTTIDFKVLRGSNRDASISQVAGAINSAFAQVRAGVVKPETKLRCNQTTVNGREILSR